MLPFSKPPWVPDAPWDEMRWWNETMRFDELKWHEMRLTWYEMKRLNEIRWDEMMRWWHQMRWWHEMTWIDMRWHDIEMAWVGVIDEMKHDITWHGMKWNDMTWKWHEVSLGWNEMRWLDYMGWDDMRWDDMGWNEMTWGDAMRWYQRCFWSQWRQGLCGTQCLKGARWSE